VDELYRDSRRALLDALEALAGQREGLILVGAHAVYVYTGEADVAIATRTKDSDLAIDPALLLEDPLLEKAMAAAGFYRDLVSAQPGQWLSADGIPVDGIAVRDREQDLATFLATYGDPFRAIGGDVDRRVQLDIGSAGVPETFVVDGHGIIRHQHIGAITDADLPEIMAAYQEAAR